MNTFSNTPIETLQKKLKEHPVYEAIKTREDLSIFMQHHIYSVWDFMSLVKYLQGHLAPVNTPWLPSGDTLVQRFINDIVLQEESDEGMVSEEGKETYISHFNLYLEGMEELKSNSSKTIKTFVEKMASHSLEEALHSVEIPNPSKAFMEVTFNFLKSDKPHVIGAAFALGREHIIPQMFKSLLEKMNISQEEAKVFHYYLDRHIELDGDHHGPMALRMLEILCEGDEVKITQAKEAALEAIQARITFWDGVLEAIHRA